MDFFTYLLFRWSRTLFTLFPLEVNFRLGQGVGTLCYYLLWPYRRLALANLRIAFGSEKTETEIRALARRHFANLGANLLSSLKLATMKFEEIEPRVTVENKEAIMSARAEGRGAIFVNNHSGAWELYAQITPFFPDRRYGAVYQRLGNPRVEKAIKEDRARFGVTPFPTSDGFSAPIAFLRDGGLVSVMVDQHSGDGGVWTPLFGRLASTSPVAATLALRTGARLVPVAIRTCGIARWHVVASEPIPLHAGNPESLTAEINRRLERQIRESPADWFWLHNRWKTPSPNFLLSKYKRGICYPKDFDPAALKPFRIIVRSSNWLGDAIISLPAVNAVKQGRPDARVTILTRAKLVDFWKRIPSVDEVLSIEPGDSLFGVARKIAGKFDVAILFPNSLRSALEAYLAGIPRRVGYPGKRKWLLTEMVDPLKKEPQPPRHQAFHYLDLAEFVGGKTGGMLPGSSPAAAPETRAVVKIGLCPGADYGPAKRWLPERFAEVARVVAERHPCEWLLFGTESDAAAGEQIASALEGKCANLIGKTTLEELMDALQQCSLLLTNDTGTMHLAAFLGVPVVAIFGSTEPLLTGPLGGRAVVLRHHVECSPCFLRECPIDFRCMKDVEAQEVAEAVFRMLGWR